MLECEVMVGMRRLRCAAIAKYKGAWIVQEKNGVFHYVPDAFVDTKTACKFLHISAPTLRRWVKQGILPRYEPTPRTHRFSLNDLYRAWESWKRDHAAQARERERDKPPDMSALPAGAMPQGERLPSPEMIAKFLNMMRSQAAVFNEDTSADAAK